MHAEAYSAAEVMHGPLALVGPGFPVLALAARDASEPSVAEAADSLAGKGAAVFVTSDKARSAQSPAACRHRPSADRPADADRVLLRLRRGLRPPSRPRSGRAAQSAQGDGNRMSDRFALTGARIFDGDDWHDDAALVVHGGVVEGIRPVGAIPSGVARVDTGGGMLAPGFVDLQVNGGGGVMLNDHPDVASHRNHLPGARAVRHDGAAADADHRHARNHRRGHCRRRRGGAAEAAGLSRPASRRPASVGRPQGRA